MTPAELRAALDDLEMSQIALAQLTGVDRSTVHRWLTGKLPLPGYVETIIQQEKEMQADDWQAGDRVFFGDDPSLCGTVMRRPPNLRLRKRGWVWVMWDALPGHDTEIQHCPSSRLIAAQSRDV